MLNFLRIIILVVQTLHIVSSWDLKGPAERYWNLKRLGLKEGHEVPFELPSYNKYYHYNHQQTSQQTYNSNNNNNNNINNNNIHSNNRIPSYSSEKMDRSMVGSHRNPAGCVYKGRKYAHSEEVATSQSCLNCTCQRGFVSCYLRVCPVLDPPENDDSCYLLKEPGACCAVLKCASSPDTPSSSTHSPAKTTKTSSSSSYHFNPSNREDSKSYMSSSSAFERKATETFRRSTARPPYKDHWTSMKPTSRHQPHRPFSWVTPHRPTSYASIARVTTTQRPVNRNGLPAVPTFSQRRPNYPVSVNSKPTLRRTIYTTSGPTRKSSTTTTAHSSSGSSHQLNAPVHMPSLSTSSTHDGDDESSHFFRMSSILV